MKKLCFYSNASLLFGLFLCLAFNSFSQTADEGMNNMKMEKIIKQEATEVEGQLGNWQLIYGDRLVLIITDEKNNRMRIFSPVIAESDLKNGQMVKMLEANFHSALDAKYSL